MTCPTCQNFFPAGQKHACQQPLATVHGVVFDIFVSGASAGRRGPPILYANDHNPPHFHARYGRANAIVRLSDGETIAGELPPTATRMVRQWALARNAELQDNWRRARAHLPLEKIAGLDADE
ncbi:MAG: DUF4160 domain-containing protein [Pseudomonadota bacterium]